jgi:hypothetical protein
VRISAWCHRCNRPFRDRERVRTVVHGPARVAPSGLAEIPWMEANYYTEHENPDHCTEPR